jgi:hypothetical protein
MERDIAAKATYDSIFGIVFMGTPHRGSKHAELGSLAAGLLKHTYITGTGNDSFIKALKRESPELEDLNRQFRNSFHLKIISVYELEVTGPGSVSSQLGDCMLFC